METVACENCINEFKTNFMTVPHDISVASAAYKVERHGPFEDAHNLCEIHFLEFVSVKGTYNITKL